MIPHRQVGRPGGRGAAACPYADRLTTEPMARAFVGFGAAFRTVADTPAVASADLGLPSSRRTDLASRARYRGGRLDRRR